VIFHEWIDSHNNHCVGYNISPGLDWPRTLGIVSAGQMKLRRNYLNDEAEAEDENEE